MSITTADFWTVAYTEPNSEKRADGAVREAGYFTFLPLHRIRKRRPKPGRPGQFFIEWLDEPLYPRYLFIGVPLGGSIAAAIEARGVASILHFGEDPVIVPSRVMDELMLRADSDGIVERHDEARRKPFKPGSEVSFADDSPLSGFIFVVKQDAGKKAKVWIESLDGKKMHVDPAMIHEVG